MGITRLTGCFPHSEERVRVAREAEDEELPGDAAGDAEDGDGAGDPDFQRDARVDDLPPVVAADGPLQHAPLPPVQELEAPHVVDDGADDVVRLVAGGRVDGARGVDGVARRAWARAALDLGSSYYLGEAQERRERDDDDGPHPRRHAARRDDRRATPLRRTRRAIRERRRPAAVTIPERF